jgi:ABC-2 type transport system permease protein
MRETLIRTSSFVRKEFIEVVRQPMLVLALIVGPFVILLAFGAGLREGDPPLRTALIVSEDSEVREAVEEFASAEREDGRLVVDSVSDDRSSAMQRLRDGELGLVIVFPDEVSESVDDEEQAVIELQHDQIDPVEGQAIELFSRAVVSEINDRMLASVIGDLQERVGGAREASAVEAPDDPEGGDVERYLELDPDVVVKPFRGEVGSLGGGPVELTDFYAPAVVVVLLQHLAVTLLGLSVVRERNLGADDMFRVSPLRTGEYLLGKFVSYLLLGGLVAAALLALLVAGLGVPMVGSWWQLTGALAILLFTSTALGLTLSLVARTDSQAVQYAMLVLLATIFLSGFLLSIERFVPVAQSLPWLLPATYGIEAVRDVMLRGEPLDPVVIGGLALHGVVFTAIGAILARRELIRPGI